MTEIKPSDHGIVVEHKETDIRFAVSDRNYDPKVHRKIRDLRPGESVQSYSPRPKGGLGAQDGPSTPEEAAVSESDASEALGESEGSPKTEGSAPAGTKGK